MAAIKTPRWSSADEIDLTIFGGLLQLLNVSAALIDHGQSKAAAALLDYVLANTDDSSKSMLQRQIQLQRAVMSARHGDFTEAAEVAMKMPADSVADTERGTAFRTIALLETKARGVDHTRSRAAALQDPEDRAYAYVGIAQARPLARRSLILD